MKKARLVKDLGAESGGRVDIEVDVLRFEIRSKGRPLVPGSVTITTRP
jgi:hypothetical protein